MVWLHFVLDFVFFGSDSPSYGKPLSLSRSLTLRTRESIVARQIFNAVILPEIYVSRPPEP